MGDLQVQLQVDVICRAIAAGSTLIELAEVYEIDYAFFLEFMAPYQTQYEAALARRNDWLAETTIMELRRHATSDIRELFSADGSLKPPSEWSLNAARAVASVKVKELFDNNGMQIGEMKEIKFWDKTKALELIGKNQKLFTDKTEHSLSKSLEELVSGSMGEKK